MLLGMQEEVSIHLVQPRYAQEHPFMTTLYSFSDGFFQKANTMSRSSDQLRMMTSSLYADLNPIEQLWDVMERDNCIVLHQLYLVNLEEMFWEMFPAPESVFNESSCMTK